MRLPTGGQIDRSKRIPFTWNGKGYIGHPGDTLASALLANDVRLMGAEADPNCRATVQEVYPGLTAASQNHLGPLSFDAMAINDHLAPFIGAGFYYKTFMWPKSFWEKLAIGNSRYGSA